MHAISMRSGNHLRRARHRLAHRIARIGAKRCARRAAESKARTIQTGCRPRSGRHARGHRADERSGLQLRRARLPGIRNLEVPDRHPAQERLHDSGGPRRHSDGVHGELGIGEAGDCARFRHRLHPAGVAEARRRVPRGDDRRRARPRRRPQLRHAAADCRGARGQENHGAAALAGDDPALAGRGRRARRDEGVLCACGRLQRRRCHAVRARRATT